MIRAAIMTAINNDGNKAERKNSKQPCGLAFSQLWNLKTQMVHQSDFEASRCRDREQYGEFGRNGIGAPNPRNQCWRPECLSFSQMARPTLYKCRTRSSSFTAMIINSARVRLNQSH